MLTFKTRPGFVENIARSACYPSSVFSNSDALGTFSQKCKKSEPWLFLEYKKRLKPQIPPDLSNFHMRNGALCIVGGHFGPKTTL